ncbi:MAG: NAD(P)-dependent alcohol dehydrogenase [Demequinaceae bacterium]|nr:NAD(P)-dependent alcohol dehydrogenase [Demequinaceae bacterium]
MKAWVYTRYGSPDTLELREVPVPVPGPKEVLVKVQATSLNSADLRLLRADPALIRLFFGLRRPRGTRIPGMDVAGVVEAVGSRVTGFAVGDAVYGESGGKCLADFAAVKASRLTYRPDTLDPIEAAATPLAALTALEAVVCVGRVESGGRVLVTGASGGVGSFAVQIAKAHGAHVTGVCSGAKGDFVLSLGADRIIDYDAEGFADGPELYDLIVHAGGAYPLKTFRRALTPRGTLALVGGDGGKFVGPVGLLIRSLLVSPFVRQRLRTVSDPTDPKGLDTLAPFFANGTVRPAIDRIFPLADAADAFRYLEARKVRGKVVISM